MKPLFQRTRSIRSKSNGVSSRARLEIQRLESRELLSFGSLVQVSNQTPFTNTSDIAGQSGTVFLNSEVEPSLAVDPRNPLHVVGAWQQDRWSNGGCRGIVAGVSTDGGNTWTLEPVPGSTVNAGGTTLRASDPWVTIAPNGDVYVEYLAFNDPNNETPHALDVNKSTDGGLTWTSPVAVITNTDNGLFNDKNTITGDPTNANNVYTVWDRLNSYNNTGPTLFSRTTDGGQTWSTPAAILDPANGQTIANQIVVLPNGTLVNMCISINYTTNAEELVVMRSTDKGATWSSPINISTVTGVGITDPDTGAGVRTGSDVPEIAVDHASGNLYVVWQDGRFSGGAHDDIAFAMSVDGGQTWTAPIKANQTPVNLSTGDEQAFLPTLAVGANGTVAVGYYDFRNNTNAPGLSTDVWVAFANPALPLAFGNEQRVTTSSFDMEKAPVAEGEFVGDYQALMAGGPSFNTFGELFGEGVSSSDPSSIFFRGIVPPNTLTLTQFTPPTAVEGQSAGGTLATFSDSSPHPDINSYTAVVSWGDGATDTLSAVHGGIVASGGSYNIVDSHAYAEESAGESFSVQITDNGGGSAGSSAAVVVTDAGLTASAATIYANEGAAVTGVTVATFTDANPAGAASDYHATLNWGDGDTTASVNVTADPNVAGQFDVVASKSHAYAEGGNYPVTVSIADAGGSTATANSIAAVADPAITVTANSLIAREGAAWTGTIATFLDARSGEALTAYSTSINWGDGHITSGTVVKILGAGHFKISASHTYAESGPYNVSVTVSDKGGATGSSSSTSKVNDAALSGTAVNFAAIANHSFGGVIATFNDANPAAAAGEFSVVIHWGDGQVSSTTATTNPKGGFEVIGSHTYATTGSFSFTVAITDDDGSRLSVKGTGTVTSSAAAAAWAWDAAAIDQYWAGAGDWNDPRHKNR